MKIDAEIRIIEVADNDMLHVDTELTIPVDLDYVDDFDDVIQQAESRLYEKYGMSLWYNVNFKILNETEICDELSEFV